MVWLLWRRVRDTTFGLQHLKPFKTLTSAMYKSGYYHLIRELRSAVSLL